jgi:putative transposase
LPEERHCLQYFLYRWKKKYGGMGVPELRRMKELEAKNSQLKRMYSDLSVENDALKELILKKL